MPRGHGRESDSLVQGPKSPVKPGGTRHRQPPTNLKPGVIPWQWEVECATRDTGTAHGGGGGRRSHRPGPPPSPSLTVPLPTCSAKGPGSPKARDFGRVLPPLVNSGPSRTSGWRVRHLSARAWPPASGPVRSELGGSVRSASQQIRLSPVWDRALELRLKPA
jgi:hypothetical protein